MIIETSLEVTLIDGSVKSGVKIVTLKAGRHEMEAIKSPIDGKAEWLVLKGTKIGNPKSFWGRLLNNHEMNFVTDDEE
jgi:hypothetical protein